MRAGPLRRRPTAGRSVQAIRTAGSRTGFAGLAPTRSPQVREDLRDRPPRLAGLEAAADQRVGAPGERRGTRSSRWNFESESLESGLDKAGFDWSEPTLFAWLGVVPYLSPDAIEATLRVISGAGPGFEVIFDYRSHDSVLDDIGRQFLKAFGELATESGEPLQPGWHRDEIEEVITGCGLKVVEHPTREDLMARYFESRSDGLMPYTAEGLVAASTGDRPVPHPPRRV